MGPGHLSVPKRSLFVRFSFSLTASRACNADAEAVRKISCWRKPEALPVLTARLLQISMHRGVDNAVERTDCSRRHDPTNPGSGAPGRRHLRPSSPSKSRAAGSFRGRGCHTSSIAQFPNRVKKRTRSRCGGGVETTRSTTPRKTHQPADSCRAAVARRPGSSAIAARV